MPFIIAFVREKRRDILTFKNSNWMLHQKKRTKKTPDWIFYYILPQQEVDKTFTLNLYHYNSVSIFFKACIGTRPY